MDSVIEHKIRTIKRNKKNKSEIETKTEMVKPEIKKNKKPIKQEKQETDSESDSETNYEAKNIDIHNIDNVDNIQQLLESLQENSDITEILEDNENNENNENNDSNESLEKVLKKNNNVINNKLKKLDENVSNILNNKYERDYIEIINYLKKWKINKRLTGYIDIINDMLLNKRLNEKYYTMIQHAIFNYKQYMSFISYIKDIYTRTEPEINEILSIKKALVYYNRELLSESGFISNNKKEAFFDHQESELVKGLFIFNIESFIESAKSFLYLKQNLPDIDDCINTIYISWFIMILNIYICNNVESQDKNITKLKEKIISLNTDSNTYIKSDLLTIKRKPKEKKNIVSKYDKKLDNLHLELHKDPNDSANDSANDSVQNNDVNENNDLYCVSGEDD